MSGHVFARQDPHPLACNQKSQTNSLIIGKWIIVPFDNMLQDVIASLASALHYRSSSLK
jgi:hypothetical protein